MWECGLKQITKDILEKREKVTPYVGVWIETNRIGRYIPAPMSLLMWECGLKLRLAYLFVTSECHSLCGSVD